MIHKTVDLNSIIETFHICDVVFNLLQVSMDMGRWGGFWKKFIVISNVYIISLINIPKLEAFKSVNVVFIKTWTFLEVQRTKRHD